MNSQNIHSCKRSFQKINSIDSILCESYHSLNLLLFFFMGFIDSILQYCHFLLDRKYSENPYNRKGSGDEMDWVYERRFSSRTKQSKENNS